MSENGNLHDCEDCVAGHCAHPDHYLYDADVDLDYLISLDAHQRRLDQLLPETAHHHEGPVQL